MAYIGNIPAEKYSAFQKQDFTTSATTSYTLDNPVANANELALFINFVRQEPGSYSASGTSLTLTEATSSSDDMYAIFLGKAIQTVNPPNSSVGTAQLVNDAVTKDKVSNLMYPAFEAKLSAQQNLANTTLTKVQWDSETFDTDNCYDNTTNYRFTPNVAGKYFVYAQTLIAENNSSDLEKAQVHIYKNGSSILQSDFDFRANPIILATPCISSTIICNGATDYIEIFAYMDSNGHTGGTAERIKYQGSIFGAYRIGS